MTRYVVRVHLDAARGSWRWIQKLRGDSVRGLARRYDRLCVRARTCLESGRCVSMEFGEWRRGLELGEVAEFERSVNRALRR